MKEDHIDLASTQLSGAGNGTSDPFLWLPVCATGKHYTFFTQDCISDCVIVSHRIIELYDWNRRVLLLRNYYCETRYHSSPVQWDGDPSQSHFLHKGRRCHHYSRQQDCTGGCNGWLSPSHIWQGWKGKIYTSAAHLPLAGWKVGRNLFSAVAVLPRHQPCSSAASRDREGKRKWQIFLFSLTNIFHLLCPSLQPVTRCTVKVFLTLFF